jgi:hypothetical protein
VGRRPADAVRDHLTAGRGGRRAIGVACALGGFLAIAVALAPSLAGRKAFVPADYWLATVPFAFAQPPAWRTFRSNALLGDPAILYPPQLWVLHEAIARGEFPLWNRWVRGGESMLGSGQAGPLAPTTWPILLLPWPDGFAWAAVARFGLLWLGAYLFGRALAVGRAGAVAIAVGFCCAPLFAVHFEQLPRATAHVALPWLLLGVERMAVRSALGVWAIARSALLLAPPAAFALLAGYPPAALTVLAGAALYAAIRLPWRPLDRALASRALAALAVALGVALAAPVLLPFATALRDSGTLADRGEGGQWTLPLTALRMLWDPYAFGSPLAHAARAWSGPENFEEAQQYVGLVPWVLLVAALPALRRLDRADRLRAAALAALAIFAASLAFGLWPLHPLVTRVPPFSVNSNPRLLFLAQTAIAALAVLATARASAERTRTLRSPAFAVGIAAAVALGIALIAVPAETRGALRPWLALAAGVALVAALRGAATLAQHRLAAALVPLVWLADVAPAYAILHPQVPRDWADPARAVAALPAPLRDDGAPRVAFERVVAPNLPALFGVEDVRAYSFPSPLRYDRYALEVMESAAPMNLLRDDLAKPSAIAGLERTCARWLLTTQRYDGTALAARAVRAWDRNDRLFLDRLPQASACAGWWPADGVTRVADLDAAVAALRASLAAPVEEIVLEEAGPAARGAPVPAIEASLRWTGANALEVDVPAEGRARDGWLVLRVSHDPGWSARAASGAPLRVVPAQVRFLAVEVPAGVERVALRYAPPRWRLAWTLSGGALAALIVSAVALRRG